MNAFVVVFVSCFALNVVYYAVARRALDRLRMEDPDRYAASGAKGGVGMSNSIGIVGLLFDRSLPKPSYSLGLKHLILAARVMLLVGSGLLIALVVLMGS